VVISAEEVVAAIDDAVFVEQWGKKSPISQGNFFIPVTIAVDDETGNVYAVDFEVKKWDRDGNFLLSWSCSCKGIDINQATHDVYVSDTKNNKIVQYTSAGTFVREWGSFGSGPGQFNRPWGVAVDSGTGNVFVVDTGNGRVQVFSGVGIFIRSFTDPRISKAAGAPAGIVFEPNERVVWVTDPVGYIVLKFDEFGTPLLQLGNGVAIQELGHFRWPRSVAVDGEGRVYVTDTDNERIQYFSADGHVLGTFQGPNNREEGPFHPRDIAINPTTGEKFVLAAYAPRIDKFDESNNYLFSFAGRPKNGLNFLQPRGIAASPVTGDVYVFDTLNFLIKRITSGGAFLSQFGGSIRISLTEPGLFGSFISSALTVDTNGHLWTGQIALHYIDDPDIMFVQKFDPEGNHLFSFFRSDPPDFYNERVRHIEVEPLSQNVWTADSRLRKAQKFDEFGNLLLEIGDVGTPSGIAYHTGHVYIADHGSNKIHKYDSSGGFVTQWGGPGSADGQFQLFDTSGVTVSRTGNVYVADTGNARVQEFGPDGSFRGKLGVRGSGLGEFLQPADLAFSPDSSILYVVDRANHRVLSFCMPDADLSSCTAQMDHDGDSVIDARDNCPFVPNPLQEDSGGTGSDSADGIGDPCQCGEVTNDGKVDNADLTLMRTHLVNLGSPDPLERCSVIGEVNCDILDMVVLWRALADLQPAIQQVCLPAVRGI
jgi:DNA-binding beta-propeller fold protein YncE